MNFIADAADRIAPLQQLVEVDLCGPEGDAFRQSFGAIGLIFNPLMTHRGRVDGTWAGSTRPSP